MEPDTIEIVDVEPPAVLDVVDVAHVPAPAPAAPTAPPAAPARNPPPGTAAPAAGKPKDARSRANSEMLEDYSLRYAPHSYRKWTEFQVANPRSAASPTSRTSRSAPRWQ
ncbi:MAG TPA: hypothetical protein VGO80_06885 [Solirubrobacteraceae bacterium]|jgi:hypothetical protein|nr:hypothetical protein [Solirubrobacteraceae bacterium]